MSGSILETFFILFETNADDVGKGTDKARESGKKMADGLKDADDVSKKLGDDFLKMSKAAVGALSAVFAVGLMSSRLMQAAAYTDELNLQAKALDVNIGKLDAYGRVMERNGGSAEGFRAGLANINQDAQNLALTGQSSLLPMMGRLGVAMIGAGGKARNVMDMLPEIADALAGMDKGQAMAIGRNLGFDEGTIMTLMQGRKAVEEMAKKQEALGVRSAKDAEMVRKFAEGMTDLKNVGMSVAMGLANIVLPVFTAINNAITKSAEYIDRHQPFFEFFFQALGAGLLVVSGIILSSYVPAMASAAAATLAATWPFILLAGLFVAVAAGFALLYDEITHYVNGQDSLIGRILGPWEDLKKKMQGALDIAKTLASVALSPMTLISKGVSMGRQFLEDATTSQIGAQSSAAITARGGNRSSSNSLSVGQMTVNTQATDAKGMAESAYGALREQVNQTIDQEDDGLEA